MNHTIYKSFCVLLVLVCLLDNQGISIRAAGANLPREHTTMPAKTTSVISAKNVTKLRELARFGAPTIQEALLSAGGTRLFLASSAGIEIYWVDTGTSIGTLDLLIPDDHLPGRISASSDGKVILAATRSMIQAVSSPDGKRLWTYPHSLSSRGSAMLSPDGYLAAITDCNQTEACVIQVFRLSDGKVVFTYLSSRPFFSPDGRWLAADVDRSLWLWDTATWNKLQHFWLDHPETTTRRISPNGELLAIRRSNLVEIREIKERKLVRTIPGLQEPQYGAVSSVFSPDSTQLAVFSERQWLIYDIQSGLKQKGIRLPLGALPYWDGTDFKGYELPKRTSYFPTRNAKAFRFVDHDQALSFHRFTYQEDDTVRSETCRLSLEWDLFCQSLNILLDKIDQKALTAWVGKVRPITPMALLGNGQFLLYDGSMPASTKAGLWDNRRQHLVQWTGFLMQWSASKDEARLAVGLRDNGIYHIEVIDLATSKSLYRKDFKSLWVLLDLAPDGNNLAMLVEQDDAVRFQVIDLPGGKIASQFDLPLPLIELDRITAIEFGTAGDFLALAYTDGRIEVRGLDGRLLHTWQAHQGEVALAFSEDGRLLATISRDGWIKTWGILP